MKKSVFYFWIFVLILILIFTFIYSQEDMKTINNQTFKNPQRPSSVFNHNEHNRKAEIENCNTCHHVYKNGIFQKDDSSIDLGCSDCHQLKSVGNMPGLMKAFHLNCKGCHKKKKTGPIMCGECHKK